MSLGISLVCFPRDIQMLISFSLIPMMNSIDRSQCVNLLHCPHMFSIGILSFSYLKWEIISLSHCAPVTIEANCQLGMVRHSTLSSLISPFHLGIILTIIGL